MLALQIVLCQKSGVRPLAQETDPKTLRKVALILDNENKKLLAKVLELEKQNLRLKGVQPSELQQKLMELERQLTNARRALFGESTEKRPHPKNKEPDPPAEPKPGHGPRGQLSLEKVEEIHQLDEADKICPKCGGALEEWKGQFEESELIDVIERRFVIRQVKRQKYRCRCVSCVETALGPTPLLPGGRYSPDFAVEVAVAKYLDHLPLQRQARMMAREGLQVTAQTLWDQLDAAAHRLEPLYQRIRDYVLSHEVIGSDETHWNLLGNDGRERVQKRWQVWVTSVSDAVAYCILPSRSASAAEVVLGDYAGVVMADGYGVYEHFAKRGKIVLANCWAHVRRKFFELENVISKETREEILALIGELYAVDREARGDLEMLARLRQQRSREVIGRLRQWLFAMRSGALPRSALAKAIDYALERWTGLTRFLEDARIPLDNNASERALRGLVVGRKNHYGSKSRRGTEVAALFYTLCETAKLAGVEPKEYVRTSLRRALDGATPLLPAELAAETAAETALAQGEPAA